MKRRLKSLLQTGDQLELQIGTDSNHKTSLTTSLTAVLDQEHLVMRANSSEQYELLQYANQVDVIASVDSAGIIKIKGHVQEWTQDGEMVTLIIKLDSPYEQTQRRQHYRLPTLQDIDLKLVGENYHKGLTQNLSAGGMRCVVPSYIREGAQIKVKMDLDNKTLELKGKVLESTTFDSETGHYVLRIMFMELSKKEEQLIHSYIFKRQCRR